MNNIYLDYNACAPLRPEVRDIMMRAMEKAHNASAIHSFGRQGRSMVETAREEIAKLVNIPSSQIIFNSGATESNNTVLHHFANAYPDEQILTSSIEHPSILQTAINVSQTPVTQDGLLDLNALETNLKNNKTSLVSVMLVNNETGVIQPVKEISDIAHKHGALFHVDGVQAAGRIEIDMPAMGIDFLSLSAHKIGGPQGIGALCLALCGITPTLLHGGGQEKSARAGTENVAGITGFGLAAKRAHEEISKFQSHLSKLQSHIESELTKYAHVKIHAQNAPRVANTTLLSIEGLSSETLLMNFDLEGIAISNGSACSSGKVEPSHVLLAMGENEKTATAALRISTGWDTTQADIDAFLNTFEKIYTRMEKKINA